MLSFRILRNLFIFCAFTVGSTHSEATECLNEIIAILAPREAHPSTGMTLQWYEFDPLIQKQGSLSKYDRNAVGSLYVDMHGFPNFDRQFYTSGSPARALLKPQIIFQRQAYLTQIYQQYHTQEFAELVKHLNETESELFIQRMDFGFVQDNQHKLLGGIRVYDGTIHHYPTKPDLPAEVSFSLRHLKMDEFKNYRKQIGAKPLFEIGNFYIGDAPIEVKIRVKAALLKVLQERYLNRFPEEAEFVAHVADRGNLRRNIRDFGFESRQESIDPATGKTEWILSVSAKKLEAKLESFFESIGIKKP